MSLLTFRQEMDQAKLVLYGTVANPRFNTAPGAPPGSSTTDFRVVKVLKDNPVLGGRDLLQLNRYVPVLDAKDPPKFVVFCNVVDGKVYDYLGRSVRSDAILRYVGGAKALQGKDRTDALLYYFGFLDNADEVIRNDAFLEFAKSTDQEIGAVARRLPADKLRALLQDSKTPASHLGLYAFLLGANGTARDAELLHDLITHPTERTAGALDGLLGGYISLRPEPGWDLVVSLLTDKRRPLTQRFCVSRTLRFFHNWKPAESKQQVLRGLAVMVEDGDLADLAIEDLRKWQMWELTGKVLAAFGQKSHASPITRRSIARYALSCPLPDARQFVERLRRQDPLMVQELEEVIAIEKRR
jgi:hypothetical protein